MDQIYIAAQAVVSPSTDARTRYQSSSFLQDWIRQPSNDSVVWENLSHWIVKIDDHCSVNADAVPIAHLAIQLLHQKLRLRPSDGKLLPGTSDIHHQARKYLLQTAALKPNSILLSSSLLQSFSSLVAALYVYEMTKGSPWILWQECAGVSDAPHMELFFAKIVEHAPAEYWGIVNVTNAQMASLEQQQMIQSQHPALLYWCHQNLPARSRAIIPWIRLSNLTLSQLFQSSIIQRLLELFHASATPSRIFTEALLVSSDGTAETRRQACHFLFHQIPWNEQTTLQMMHDETMLHALEHLVGSFLSEEADFLVTQPATSAFQTLLLEILNFSGDSKPRANILEGLLSVQELPTSERREEWRAPFFAQVVGILLSRTQYDVVEDEDEMEEHRRLVKDVYISAYFLLRSRMIDELVNRAAYNVDASWESKESAIFALACISREVCARVKSKGGDTILSNDRQLTVSTILNMVAELCRSNENRPAPLASSIVQFLGNYAPSWATICDCTATMHILQHSLGILVTAPVKRDASNCVRAILVNCTTNLSESPQLFDVLKTASENALDCETDAIKSLIEGCTRTCMQLKTSDLSMRAFHALIDPILSRGDAALQSLPQVGYLIENESQATALVAVEKSLEALQTVVRFSDSATECVCEFVGVVMSFLERCSRHARHYEIILTGVLRVQENLLKNLPELVVSFVPAVLKYVSETFAHTSHPSALEYFSSAVEILGPTTPIETFAQLLDRVTEISFQVLSTGGNHSSLITSFYELIQRFIIFCPRALLRQPVFSNILAGAVEAFKLSGGEKDSSRAVLNFLSKIFGWRELSIADEHKNILLSAAHFLDEQLIIHGAVVLRMCFSTLLEGPQMLGPACVDCIFAITNTAKSWPVPEDSSSNIARHWLVHVGSFYNRSSSFDSMTEVLLFLATKGEKSQPKIKMMLADFGKVYRGEEAEDIIRSYTL